MKPKIAHVVGARPQFIKAAVICRRLAELGADAPFDTILIHTGQHYDTMLSDTFFNELSLPAPEYNLGVGSGSIYAQTARIISEIGPVLEKEQPAAVLVYGDTNSTVGAAVAAHKLTIPVIHLEAGVRIFQRDDQPEEINRILTDHSSALCLACTERAYYNLRREGMAPPRVALVGDPMYELFLWAVQQLPRLSSVEPAAFGLKPGEFNLATIHRAENTSTPEILVSILDALDHSDLPVLLPLHPRVRNIIDFVQYKPHNSLVLTDPLGYFDLISLLLSCKRVATDSGGVTREAFFAGKPSILPRVANCWTEIYEAGWIQYADTPESLTAGLNSFEPANDRPEGCFGDGNTGAKVVDQVASFIDRPHRDGPWHAHGFADDLPLVSPTTLTFANYGRLLDGLKDSGYEFAEFRQAEELLATGKPFVLMRHDIDMSLPHALNFAHFEAERGVRSTYFFMVRTRHYNLFSREGTETVNKILELGHHLGLHFDCASYPASYGVEDLARACDHEVALLREWFHRGVEVVSYHRPSETVLSGNPALSGNVPHTYMKLYTSQIRYLADSRGEWRHGHPLESEEFQQKQPLHLLVHPIWWNHRPVSSYETLLRFAQQHFDSLEKSMAQNCVVYRTGSLVGEEPQWIK